MPRSDRHAANRLAVAILAWHLIAALAGAIAPASAQGALPDVYVNYAIFESPSGIYALGEPVLLDIVFTDEVTVDTTGGAPTLAMDFGRDATYLSGSGTIRLRFRLWVEEGDFFTNIDYASTTALATNGARIYRAVDDQDADLTLPPPGTPGALSYERVVSLDAMFGLRIQVDSYWNRPDVDGVYHLPEQAYGTTTYTVRIWFRNQSKRLVTFNQLEVIDEQGCQVAARSEPLATLDSGSYVILNYEISLPAEGVFSFTLRFGTDLPAFAMQDINVAGFVRMPSCALLPGSAAGSLGHTYGPILALLALLAIGRVRRSVRG